MQLSYTKLSSTILCQHIWTTVTNKCEIGFWKIVWQNKTTYYRKFHLTLTILGLTKYTVGVREFNFNTRQFINSAGYNI